MKKQEINKKKKIATTSMVVLGLGLIVTGAFAALSDNLSHDETVVIEWVDIVDGSASNLALEDVSDASNTPVSELTPGITYELTGTLNNNSTVVTNWYATDVTNTPGMTVTINDYDGNDIDHNPGEDIDVAQFGITVVVDQSITPSAPVNFALEFSSTDARVMLSEATAISSIFPDPALATCIAGDDESPANGDVNYLISQKELNNIKHLDCASMGIVNIEGLQYLTNLEYLSLADNQISDLTPIANLYHLTELMVHYNEISDLSPVANLYNLELIDLGYNQISDLSPLSELTNLTHLYLAYNQVSDLSPIANLTNLELLNLAHNQVSDISVVANMENLIELNLYNNQVTDVSAIAGLENLTYLSLGINHISDFSALTYQPTDYFYAKSQTITLPDVALGTPTQIALEGIAGEALTITWTTPGTYANGEIIWENPGVNSLTFKNANGSITGTITQTVY